MPYEAINNIVLIQDSIDHIQHELSGKRNLVRIAVESHQILLRSMVQALRGSNNLAITGRRPKHWEIRYEMGNQPCKVIEEQPIAGCEKAWRFSEPRLSPEPLPRGGVPASDARLMDQHLLGFYDFLAMVQTECRMGLYDMSKPIHVPDSEMRILEWLHEDVRNATEHFVPQSYLIEKQSLLMAIHLCVKYSGQLFFESNTIFLLDKSEPVKSSLEALQAAIGELLPCPFNWQDDG